MSARIGDLFAHLDDAAVCTQCSQTCRTNARLRAFSPSTRSKGEPNAVEAAELRASLGDALRGLRAELGLSQRCLSEQAGVSRRALEYLEAGRRRPTASMLASLVVAASWSVPLGPSMPHAEQAAWLDRLIAATGPNLAPDTPGGLRRRLRRLGAAERAWRMQSYRARRAALAVEAARRRELMAGVRVLARARSPQAIERAMSGLGW